MSRDVHQVLDEISRRAVPDVGAAERFEARLRRWERRRRASALAMVIAVAIAAGFAVVRSLRTTAIPTGTQPRVVDFRDGRVRFEVPAGWEIAEGPAQLTFSHRLPGGEEVEVFAWDLGDAGFRPIDPTTGEPGPAGVGITWYDRFADREDDLPAYESQQQTGFVSYWASDDAMPLLWLLSAPDVDLGSVERTDYRIDEHFAPRTGFVLGAPVPVGETAGGGTIVVPAGRVWAWYSPLSRLNVIVGYTVPPDADVEDASALVAELLRGTDLPTP